MTLVAWFLGGLVTGMPFGAMVLVGEYLLRRRVRVGFGMAGAIAAAAGASWALIEFEFSRQELLPAFAQPCAAMALSGGALLAASRPMKPKIA